MTTKEMLERRGRLIQENELSEVASNQCNYNDGLEDGINLAFNELIPLSRKEQETKPKSHHEPLTRRAFIQWRERISRTQKGMGEFLRISLSSIERIELGEQEIPETIQAWYEWGCNLEKEKDSIYKLKLKHSREVAELKQKIKEQENGR